MDLNQAIISIGKRRHNAGLELTQWVPIAFVLSFATILCFYRINAEGLWLDEFSSIRDAKHIPSLLRPLYYVLLKFWMKLGNSDTWLRSLSVIFALLAVFLVYRLGRRLLGEAEGLIAATLMSLSPLFLNHAQEVRMYALSACMGVAGTLFLAKALTEQTSKAPSHLSLAGWCRFRLLAILTVPLNITLLLPDVLIYWLRFRQRRSALIRFGGWLLLLLLLWSPCVLSVLQGTSADSAYASHHASRRPPGLDEIVRTLKFWTVWPFAVQTNAIAAAFYKLFTLLLAGLIGAALFQKHKSPHTLWIFGWLVLPLVPILGFSYLSIPIWVVRYLLFVSPYLFLILAAAISRLWRQWRLAAITIVIFYLIAASGGLVRYYTVQDRPDYKFVIETIERYEQPGDSVVWSLFYLQDILPHYYQGSLSFHYNPTRKVESLPEINAWLDNFPKPDNSLGDENRLWVVIAGDDESYPSFEQQLKARYIFEKTFDYEQGAKVLLLTQSP